MNFDLQTILKVITIALFLIDLLLITVNDIRTMEIPVQYNIFIFVLGIAAIWTWGNVSLLSRVIGMLAISLPMFLIVLLVPGGFGGGDIKLMFAAGFLLGWKAIVVAFFIGLLLGGAYGAVALALRKKGRKEHFAFGPFLSVGLTIAVFKGNELMDLYLRFSHIVK